MKITLISPYPDITNYGLRTLSGVLREAGHETQVIFMRPQNEQTEAYISGRIG